MHLLLNTSHTQRFRQRRRKGFQHVLKPLGCRPHLYTEAEVAACLRGQTILNMGSDVAVDLQRGFGRLNSTTRRWNFQGATAEESRLPFRKRRPTYMDFMYQFERTGGFNGRGPDVMAGQAFFGDGSVGTQFLQHPPHYGLANLLMPQEVQANASGRQGFRRAEDYERYMCRHDVVVLESGLADFGLSFGHPPHVTWATNLVRPACSGATEAACEAALAPALRGEDWRRFPMDAYLARLRQLLGMWTRCRKRRPAFRGIFKLAPAPRARQRPADCRLAQWGFSTQAHHLALVNAAARREVAAAGFEVFEAFGVTLHAPPPWFDDARYGVRFKIHEAEALSDVTTQAFLGLLCSKDHGIG